MRMLRLLLIAAVATIAFALLPSVSADAQTKVTIGKVIGGDGFHVPTYVALDQGFFKAEGLDGSLSELRPAVAGHRRDFRQSRLCADPVGRRASGAERRQDHVHRR